MKKNFIGFVVGVVSTVVVAWKVFKVVLGKVAKHEMLIRELKDSWIDLFIRLLYCYGTEKFVDRKTTEYTKGYYRRPYTSYSSYRPRYKDFMEDDWD